MKYWEQIKEKILLSKQHIGPYSPNHNRLQDSLQKHKNRQISNIYIYSLHKLPNRQISKTYSIHTKTPNRQTKRNEIHVHISFNRF